MRGFLLRIPFFRYCRLQYWRRVREIKREGSWADTQGVLIALGNITIAWAGINLILNHFFEQYQLDGGPLIRKQIPRSFAGKLVYMEEIEHDPRWAEYPLAVFRGCRMRLAELNEFRVGLVHGLLVKRGYDPSWTIHMAKEDKARILRWTTNHTSQDIHNFSKELSDMGHALSILLPPASKQDNRNRHGQ